MLGKSGDVSKTNISFNMLILDNKQRSNILNPANLFMIKNKTEILQEIKNRYLNMQKIVVDNKKSLINK